MKRQTQYPYNQHPEDSEDSLPTEFTMNNWADSTYPDITNLLCSDTSDSHDPIFMFDDIDLIAMDVEMSDEGLNNLGKNVVIQAEDYYQPEDEAIQARDYPQSENHIQVRDRMQLENEDIQVQDSPQSENVIQVSDRMQLENEDIQVQDSPQLERGIQVQDSLHPVNEIKPRKRKQDILVRFDTVDEIKKRKLWEMDPNDENLSEDAKKKIKKAKKSKLFRDNRLKQTSSLENKYSRQNLLVEQLTKKVQAEQETVKLLKQMLIVGGMAESEITKVLAARKNSN